MARPARLILLLVAILVGLAAIAWPQRRMVALRLYALVEGPPPLGEAAPEPDSVAWFDDYFTIEFIDPQTIAIGEPRYLQQNYNYLILGEDRAILFDSGPGVRDITPVVESLTALPVTAVPSHLHFDHIGNHTKFDRIALVDLPDLRARASSGVLRPTAAEHLGFIEDFEPPALTVSEWWPPGTDVDLGARSLRVIHAPGHTPESIVLLDLDRGLLFTGDYIYEGPLFVFLPGSSLDDYRRTARKLIEMVPPGTRLLSAHRTQPPGAPILSRTDLVDLGATLEQVRAGTLKGEGFYLKSYRINARLQLLAERP